MLRSLWLPALSACLMGCAGGGAQRHELSSSEKRLIGVWDAKLAEGPIPFRKRDDSKQMSIELRSDGTYSSRFYHDEHRSHVDVEIAGEWRASEDTVTLTPSRQTLFDAYGNKVSDVGVLGTPTAMKVDSQMNALVPPPGEKAMGRFIFVRAKK
jgi:hypothetical protein